LELRQPHTSHPTFDIAETIINAGNCPPPVDLKPWQDRIDLITGKNSVGHSKVRLVWGQDLDKAGAWICGKRRAKYPFYRYEEAGEIRDIGTPRFYVEELHNNAELRKDNNWEKNRYYFDPQLGLLDVLGPIPDDGFYTSVFIIALHDEICCNGSGVVNNDICLGAFRPPCDADLQRIRRMKWNRDHASNEDLRPSQSLIEKRTEERSQKFDELIDRESSTYMGDFFKTHGWKLTTDDPSRLNWGKYAFVGSHSKSGATVEQITKWRKEKATNVSDSSDDAEERS
jgi:hypothetical protein